jgi:hypothetical protein
MPTEENIMPITTSMVATVRLGDGATLAAWWDGGCQIGIHIDCGHGLEQIDRWNVWNEEWNSPLIEPTRDSFERFVAARLAEPGLLDELVAAGAEH